MSSSQDAAPRLHLTRAEKFRILDEAVALQRFSRRGWRVSAHAYIKTAELKTQHDGWSHLRQQDMEEFTGCGDEKLKAIRDELARLGWIEVAKGCPACGYPKAVSVRVNWPTIAAAVQRLSKSGNESRKPDSYPRNRDSCAGKPDRHNKELTSHGAPCLNPMQDDGAYADGIWPPDISREMLRSPTTVDRLYRGAVGRGWIDPGDKNARVGVHGAAIYTLRRKGIEKPGGYFQSLVKRKWWLIAPNERRGMPDEVDAEAHQVIRRLDRPTGETTADRQPAAAEPQTIGDTPYMQQLKAKFPAATGQNKNAAAAGCGVQAESLAEPLTLT